MAEPSSKTARRAVRAGTSAGGAALSSLGEHRYVVPLNGGRHAYVRNLTTGRTWHLKTASNDFVDEMRQLAEAGHGAKVRAELDRLSAEHPADGWDATLKRLVAAGVFES